MSSGIKCLFSTLGYSSQGRRCDVLLEQTVERIFYFISFASTCKFLIIFFFGKTTSLRSAVGEMQTQRGRRREKKVQARRRPVATIRLLSDPAPRVGLCAH